MKSEFNPVFEINREAVHRRMRLKTGTPVYKAVQEVYDTCLRKTAACVMYQAVYLLGKNDHRITQPDLDGCSELLYCFITIGQPVLDVIDGHFEDGRYLEGYLINEMANEAVMSASNQLYHHVKQVLHNRGCRMTQRFSPGECHLDLSCNKLVMEALESGFQVSATLTDQMMLNPPKSMLFLYGVDPDLPEGEKDRDCGDCQRMKCNYRLAQTKPITEL